MTSFNKTIMDLRSRFILWSIQEKPMCSYELSKSVITQKQVPGTLNTSNVKLQMTLKSLEKNEFIKATSNNKTEDPKKRIIYEITRTGKSELRKFRRLLNKEYGDFIKFLNQG